MRSSPGALIAVLVTILTLFSLAGYQVTNETAGVRMLGRIGAAMIEIDRWLPAHRENIELLAQDRPETPLELPNLPFDVAVHSSFVTEGSETSLRAALSGSIGRTMYREGPDAIRGEDGENNMGITEPVRWAVTLLSEDAHRFWQLALLVSGLSLLALSAGLIWTRQSPLMPLAIGGGVAALLSLVVWLGALMLASAMDGAINKEIALVLRDGAWVGLRNGLAVFAIGLAAAYVLGTLLGPRDREWDEWAEYDAEPESRESPPY